MPDAVAQFLSALRELPLWLLAALALAGYAILNAPEYGGVSVEAFRREWGPWFWAGSLLFTILALARAVQTAVAVCVARAAQRQSRRVLRFVPLRHQCWWSLAKQRDDRFTSQLAVTIQVSNLSDKPIQVVRVDLMRPSAKLIDAMVMLPVEGSPYHSSKNPVPSCETVPMSVHLMAWGKLGRRGHPLRASITFTDQHGERYLIRGIRFDCRDKREPWSLGKTLRSFRARREERRPPPPTTWTFQVGHPYIDLCEAILSEERRSYLARGRPMGGLGSLNTNLQSEPNSGWTKQGEVPPLLWERREAKRIASPNLDRLLRLHESLGAGDRANLQSFLLTHLRVDSAYSSVAYFTFLALHRLGRTIDALRAARSYLVGDRDFAYSNVLGVLSAVVSHEHFDISAELNRAILTVLDGDQESDFRLREKLNLAGLNQLDRESASPG